MEYDEPHDQRSATPRRAADLQLIATLIGLAMILFAWGIAWATATNAVAQKLDRAEFARYVAENNQRFSADSIERSYQSNAWRRIEVKVDSTNERLSRLICERGPSYCR